MLISGVYIGGLLINETFADIIGISCNCNGFLFEFYIILYQCWELPEPWELTMKGTRSKNLHSQPAVSSVWAGHKMVTPKSGDLI